MTVEVKEDKIKTIQWQQCKAIFTNGMLTEFSCNPSREQVEAEPEGFAQFAIAIHNTIQANRPPEPKKPRKRRSDWKGKSKPKPGAILHTEPGAEYKTDK